MGELMAVLLNGIAQLEYDRGKPLSDYQLTYLEKMDSKMATGIAIGEESMEDPDENQRAQFVAANLYHAIKSEDEAMCSALSSYLATRLPELKQVKLDDSEGHVTIELVFDQKYGKQVPVSFTKH
jgi:hypothetical protein